MGAVGDDGTVAPFSSRGMTLWELPYGYGRVKPDICTPGVSVVGAAIGNKCRSLSGTSVACPLVTGAVALLASVNRQHFNLASVKQVLLESAVRLPVNHIYEQGAGRLDIVRAVKLFSSYTPRVTAYPSDIDLSDSHLWHDIHAQPLYYTSRPIILNITILNGMGPEGYMSSCPDYIPHGLVDNVLVVSCEYGHDVYPYVGWVAIYLTTKYDVISPIVSRGTLSIRVYTKSAPSSPTGVHKVVDGVVRVPLAVPIIPTPPRSRRILFDMYHSLKYPPGNIPSDTLPSSHILSGSVLDKMSPDGTFSAATALDEFGDHIHTNFRSIYGALRTAGYYVETLGYSYACVNASLYGTYVIVDPEDVWTEEEIAKVVYDMKETGIGVLIIADWYDADVMRTMRVFDSAAKRWWSPVTGGANLVALNDLVRPFGVEFASGVWDGEVRFGDRYLPYCSGTSISMFPGMCDV